MLHQQAIYQLWFNTFCSGSGNLFICWWILLFGSTEQFQAKNHYYFSISYFDYLASFINIPFERTNSVLIVIQFFVLVSQQAHTNLIMVLVHVFLVLENETWRLAFVWMFKWVKNTFVHFLIFLEFLTLLIRSQKVISLYNHWVELVVLVK